MTTNAKTVSAPTRRAVVSVTGHITENRSFPAGVAALVEQFLTLAGLFGNFVFNIQGPNDSVNFHRDGIRIRLQGATTTSCGMTVRCGGNKYQYGGYLHSQSGHKAEQVYAILHRLTQKGYWFPSPKTSPVTSTAAQPTSNVPQPAQMVSASESSTSTATDTQAHDAHEEHGQVNGATNDSNGSATNGHAGTPPENTTKSMFGASKDSDTLELIKSYMLDLFPSGRAHIKGLGVALNEKMKLNARPKAFGPLFKAMVARKLIDRSEDGKVFILSATVAPSRPTAASSSSNGTTSAPATPVAAAPSNVADMMDQMELMAQMAVEYGKALELSGSVTLNIQHFEEQLVQQETELRELVKVREASINELKGELHALQEKQAEYSTVLNSEVHKRARAFIARIRDIKLD